MASSVWADRFGNLREIGPGEDWTAEDQLAADGFHYVDQRNGGDWIARNLGDVPHITMASWVESHWLMRDAVPVESLGREA